MVEQAICEKCWKRTFEPKRGEGGKTLCPKCKRAEIGKNKDLLVLVCDELGEAVNITENMYWFEEQGVKDINEMKDVHGRQFFLRVFVGGEEVIDTLTDE